MKETNLSRRKIYARDPNPVTKDILNFITCESDEGANRTLISNPNQKIDSK